MNGHHCFEDLWEGFMTRSLANSQAIDLNLCANKMQQAKATLQAIGISHDFDRCWKSRPHPTDWQKLSWVAPRNVWLAVQIDWHHSQTEFKIFWDMSYLTH